MFQFAQKIKFVKRELKTWAKSHFGNFHDKVSKNEDKIRYVESKLLDNPSSFRLNSWLTWLLKQREKLLLYNQKYWGEFKRKEWLTRGDRNTTFFQRSAGSRRRKKRVIRLKNDSDIWVDDPTFVATSFISDILFGINRSTRENALFLV